MQYAERDLARDDFFNQCRMRLLECLNHLLHFLPSEQIGRTGLECFQQMRRDHGGGLHHHVAQRLGFIAARSGDPTCRHAERGINRFHAFDLGDNAAGVEGHHETRQYVGPCDFRTTQLDDVFVRG